MQKQDTSFTFFRINEANHYHHEFAAVFQSFDLLMQDHEIPFQD